jgi:chromate reductase, NAD(P)H dehydrogenase (quinone)
MTQTRDIAVLVGSLRRESFNRKAALALAKLAPEGLKLEIVPIGGLPLYDQDLDEDPPAAWTDFRERVRRADGLLFVTPEYNRSVPGVLKNAIDVGSRPYGKSAFQEKPGAVISVSPGRQGGFGANHHLRQSCVFLDIPLMQQPEAYLGGVTPETFGSDGAVEDAQVAKLLRRFILAYGDWVEKILRGPGELA